MRKHITGTVLFAALVTLLTHSVLAQQADQGMTPKQAGKSPVKVFILAGQSNMQGQGVVQMKDKDGNEKPGTLVSMLKDPAKAPLLKPWVGANGDWAEGREDVWVYDVSERGSRHGALAFGYGWNLGSREWFGPELQFGHLLGNHFENQVLIIKTAWGGRDLYKDFRPPSSGGTVGPFYTQMLATANMVLGDLKTQFPGYAGGGYELAGFVWWHGWNDFCSPKIGVPEYEQNLVNLITDVRRDLKAPSLPVVIGEFTGPWGADCKEAAALAIRKAQKDAAARPEFAGTVRFVETHDFVRAEKDSPTKEGYHEFKNGETYFLIGDALGKAMKKLLTSADGDAGFKPIFDGKTLEGWKAADMSYWAIEDGAITGKITKEHPLKDNLYLIWQGGELADFELKLKSRVFGSPGINNGFQFRSKELPNHDVAGYQVDNNLDTPWLVRLYDEHGRETLAWRGQQAVFDENGKVTHTDIPEAKGTAWFKREEWHEYHLICEGPHLTLQVDGRLAAEVVDKDPQQQDFTGILALQLHTGPPTTAQFKDIRLKVLKPAAAVKSAAQPASAPTGLRDKTLVAWVSPANLTQRGGSVLTIDDVRSHFDGIVLGELAPKRWMAGSDFFRRTHREQDQWPEETADPKTLIQVAIAYQGKQVTLYRNGRQYAEYTMASSPQEFGPQSVVVVGKRHLEQMDDAHFTGSIDDARIYNVALTAEQIAALKPNEPSDPKPLAWWDFEDGRAVDRMKLFPATTLFGDARIADGRLHLDKSGAYLLASKTTPETEQASTDLSNANSTARALREKLLSDPYRPGYHFVTPEGSCMPFDPNGAIYWKGRYHLFYIFQDKRGHNWGHVSSTDLFHWRHHPTGLVSGMFSGNCFINKEGRPTMCYHQVGQGNAMAVALDDELSEWKKLESNPITPKTKPGDPHHDKYRSWDPYGWLEGDTYYAIFGGERPAIAKAPGLGGEWKYVGDLMATSIAGVSINEDVSCADFFKIGDRHMLLCISHRLGCRYYLGDWKGEQFHPTFHERMSWVDNSFFAPESLLDDKGRRIMWAWIFDSPGFKMRSDYGWSGTMSLPRVLSLGEDGRLRMNPPEEIEKLRYNGKKRTNLTVKADSDLALEGIGGNSIELALEMNAKDAKQFGIKIGCSPGGEEQTLVYYDAVEKKLKVDTTQSSLTEGPKSVEAGPFDLKADEPLKLRVFVDKSVVEVFASGRQAVMRRIYPSRPDSVGVKLFSKGGEARVPSLEAWEMAASNPY